VAYANPLFDSAYRYLKDKFALREDFICEPLNQTFTYGEVKEALRKLSKTDPQLHRMLSYRWMTNRSRFVIASILYMDSSTLKRRWDRGIIIFLGWLQHGDLVEELPAIDLVN